ncbi:MAG: RsmE family RNA methyltransferase [Anaerolineae bacterium]
MHRFFVPPDWLRSDEAVLHGPAVHQIRNVLRLRAGEEIMVLDNSGWQHRIHLTLVDREEVRGRIVQKTLAPSEPRTKITLYQAVLKGRSFEFVLQKGTELGVVAFVPVVSQRTIIASLDNVTSDRQERWRRIIQEAAEQSGRGRMPELQGPLMLRQAWEAASQGGATLVASPAHRKEEAGARSKRRSRQSDGGDGRRGSAKRGSGQATRSGDRDVTAWPLGKALRDGRHPPFSVNLFIGPEGGFTRRELAEGSRYGAVPVTLGPRVLRAETAGLVAATAILYELGDMEPAGRG